MAQNQTLKAIADFLAARKQGVKTTIEAYEIALEKERSSEECQYDYAPDIAYEYQKFLEELIKNEPKNIKARLSLASIYLIIETDRKLPIKVLREALVKYEKNLSLGDKVKLYTNLAYCYSVTPRRALCQKYLEKAVALNSNAYQPYSALGVLYSSCGREQDALALLKKADGLEANCYSGYNYAIGLFRAGKYAEAKAKFEAVSSSLPKYYYAPLRALYVAACRAYLGHKSKAIRLADKLWRDSYSNLLSTVEARAITDIYFLCGAWEKIADTLGADETLSGRYVAVYFHALKSLGDAKILKAKYREFIAREKRRIEKIKAKEIKYDYDKSAKNYQIRLHNKAIRDIKEAFNASTSPKIRIDSADFARFCYLMDCPIY